MTSTMNSVKRNNKHRSVLYAAAAILVTSQFSYSGAWVPKEGSGYAKVGVAKFEADDFFGDNTVNTDFDGLNISYYGEYGLGNDLGVFWSVLYQDIEQTDGEGVTTDNSGFSDLEVGVRYNWISEPFVFSTSFLAKLPYLYDEDDELPLGNGQEDFEVKALFGKALGKYGYWGAELGYRLRTDSPSDEYRYLLEYGFSFDENLYFRTKLDAILSVENADQVRDDSGTGNLSQTPEFDLGKLELTVGWNFGEAGDAERWGVEFTYTDDLYGDETLDGETVQLGITRQF